MITLLLLPALRVIFAVPLFIRVVVVDLTWLLLVVLLLLYGGIIVGDVSLERARTTATTTTTVCCYISPPGLPVGKRRTEYDDGSVVTVLILQVVRLFQVDISRS
jgi:hypothetical protein